MTKKICIYLAMLAMCSACSKNEKLLIGGIGWQEIAIVNKKSGEIEWKHSLSPDEECNDVDMNKRGEILYAYKQGAKLIKRSGEVVWDYKVGENEAVYSASVIESGNYMIAIAGKPLARIVELNGKNEVLKEVRFNTTTFDVSRQFRQVLKTPQNTYLVPLTFKRKISEISEEGRYLKSVLCNGAPNAVKIAANGNWVVSCGSIHSFSEIDPQTKKIVKTIETTNLNWGSLLYVSELVCYPNGNTLVSNSSMESDDKSQPMLLEIDPDGQVVWRMPFNPGITNITTVHSFYE